MTAPISRHATAQIVARNLVPVAGILFLGWKAPNVLLLYFADTIFAIAVVAAGVLRHFAPPPKGEGWASRVNGEAGAIAGGAFIAAVIAIPLLLPLFFMLGDRFAWRETLADPALRGGLAWQAVAAWWSYFALYRALGHRSPAELGLKRRFALVFMRWMAVVIIGTTGIGTLFGASGAFLFVALYAALSIVAEIAPDRLLRAFPASADCADSAPSPRASSARRARRPRRVDIGGRNVDRCGETIRA